MTTLRAAAQQALEVLKLCTPKPRPTDDDYAEQGWKEHNAAITALRAALAQQAEPVEPAAYTTGHCENHKQKGGCQLHNLQCGWPDCDRKPTTAPPQQAEPLNLSDPAVQKRLATQWGYVPAAQAEPVEEPAYKVKVTSRWHEAEPLAAAFNLPDGEHLLYTAPPQRKQAQRDALLEALKSTGLFLHHCWCDVQMNEYSFEKLNQQMAVVDAAIMAVEAGA